MGQYADLLFFNRDFNCLVTVELKRGPFKTAYLGQLSGYLRVLDAIPPIDDLKALLEGDRD